MMNAMGRPAIEPKIGAKIDPEAIPSRSKIEPEQTRDHPKATLASPEGPKRKKLKNYVFEQNWVQKKDTFCIRFCIVSLYETNKTRVWRYSDYKGAREKSSVLDWKVLKI